MSSRRIAAYRAEFGLCGFGGGGQLAGLSACPGRCEGEALEVGLAEMFGTYWVTAGGFEELLFHCAAGGCGAS